VQKWIPSRCDKYALPFKFPNPARRMKWIFVLFVIGSAGASGQVVGSVQYDSLVKVAATLYLSKYYAQAALTYSSAFTEMGGMGYSNDRYNAARAWAMAGGSDSAFAQLDRIALKANFCDWRTLEMDTSLNALHRDRRWEHLLSIVNSNRQRSIVKYDTVLMRVLDSLVSADQKWRLRIHRHENGSLSQAEDSISVETMNHYVAVVDSLNYNQIATIFGKYGFPNYDLVGKRGSNNYWLLVQHQDAHPRFQKKILKSMKKDVILGRASSTNYAYLLDRVKINGHKRQVYGTQMTLNGDSSSFEPMPLKRPRKVDSRRARMGLQPIADYIKLINEQYRGRLRRRIAR
jgi:hypothetical protein